MECAILNFKRHDSGAMLGFCDLQVGGLTVRGCKLFRKDDKVWFSWPSEKRQDKDGQDVYTDIVAASEPFVRHLQALVRPQIRALLDGVAPASSPQRSAGFQRPGAAKQASNGRDRQAEDLSAYRSSPGDDDIKF
jgi:hypothetical protein